MQPYKGKVSVQPEKESNGRKDRDKAHRTEQATHWQAECEMERDWNPRMSNEPSASTGVYRIAPGPRGSAIQGVDQSQKGKAPQGTWDPPSMTTAEFEQQILRDI